MTDHLPGDLVGVFADKLQVELPAHHAEGEHSYRVVTQPTDDNPQTTATIEAEFTYFEFRGDLFVFDGIEYRPNSEYRTDNGVHEGNVRMKESPGVTFPELGHPLNPEYGYVTVDDFIDMLIGGELEPVERPEE